MPHFVPGDFLPEFMADSSVNSNFAFSALGGRSFLLAFVGTVRSDLGRKVAEALLAEADWLGKRRILVYVVTSDSRTRADPILAQLRSRFTIFWDDDLKIAQRFGMDATPASSAPGAKIFRLGLLLARRNLRMHAAIQVSPVEGLSERLRAAVETLTAPEADSQIQNQAPVLIVPDVMDAATCRTFVDYFDRQGGVESGFMRDIDGRTQGVLDRRTKRRRDAHIADPDLQKRLRSAVTNRIVPEIRKAYAYNATRIERYMIGCYDEADRGFFSEHRDNTSKATAHRVFAVSINLNSDEYDGGALRFPEYGSYAYKPATGAAVVFSCSLLHEATPVTRGRRYVIVPFLYDDATAVKRSEGRKFLSDAPPLRLNEPAMA